jgi:hypothetical protein
LGCLFAGLKDTGKFPNVKSTIFSIGTWKFCTYVRENLKVGDSNFVS